MPALLKNFAEEQTHDWTELARTLARSTEGEFQVIKTLPNPLQAQRAVSASQRFVGFVPPLVSILDDWVQSMEGFLREGINGLDFRIFVDAGLGFVAMCDLAVDAADRICQQAEAFGESRQTTAARDVLATALVQMHALKLKVLSWKKMADRRRPEIDPALLESGVEQLRQGHFKTPQQVLEAIRGMPE